MPPLPDAPTYYPTFEEFKDPIAVRTTLPLVKPQDNPPP